MARSKIVGAVRLGVAVTRGVASVVLGSPGIAYNLLDSVQQSFPRRPSICSGHATAAIPILKPTLPQASRIMSIACEIDRQDALAKIVQEPVVGDSLKQKRIDLVGRRGFRVAHCKASQHARSTAARSVGPHAPDVRMGQGFSGPSSCTHHSPPLALWMQEMNRQPTGIASSGMQFWHWHGSVILFYSVLPTPCRTACE
jgi:hypothetical protein